VLVRVMTARAGNVVVLAAYRRRRTRRRLAAPLREVQRRELRDWRDITFWAAALVVVPLLLTHTSTVAAVLS
ncbi:MAG TPA: hypothetical protein VGF17_15455, partial [Phytomonospora sp.]